MNGPVRTVPTTNSVQLSSVAVMLTGVTGGL